MPKKQGTNMLKKQEGRKQKSRKGAKFTSDIVIGLEIHVQLNTNSKLFCSCAAKEHSLPNTACCEICLGHPGSKPVLNKKAVEHCLKLALALNCDISNELIFSRKSYFYPDMAKNYQISQHEVPVGQRGHITLSNGKKIRIARVHIEEDPASLVHAGSIEQSQFTLVDYNRSGIPLAEIVTEPDLNSPEEAREFMKKLKTTLKYLNVFDANKGVIKADANISIKESGYVRSEVKNITGFKEIEKALFYEAERQKLAVEEGEKLVQDTRTWDSDAGKTARLREKETEADYGYIIEPDLVVTEIGKEMISKIMKELPELPEEKIKKFVKIHKIKEEDAKVIAAESVMAELFEKIAKEVDPLLAAKWLRRELMRVVHLHDMDLEELKIDELHLIELLSMIEANEITYATAKEIMELLVKRPFSPREYVTDKGLAQISDTKHIEELCEKAVKENPGAVADYKKGELKALNFLVGKVMAATNGKANAKNVKDIIMKKIG